MHGSTEDLQRPDTALSEWRNFTERIKAPVLPETVLLIERM